MPYWKVKPKTERPFEYPYLLYVPEGIEEDDSRPILVEPNNTGEPSDKFEKHYKKAREIAERGRPRTIANKLSVPLLVPVFPRPNTGDIDFSYYTHQLGGDTMRIQDSPMQRLDLQLLNMVENAQERLVEHGYATNDKFIMDGFSASAKFANRFAALHPEHIISVTAGGIGGMPILPIEEANSHILNYHIGVANIEDFTGEPFNKQAFCEVNQFLYLGEDDSNDTTKHSECWTSDASSQVALDVYGKDMQNDRFPYSKEIYGQVGASAVFRIFEDTGHNPIPAIDDVVEFHRRSITDENIEDTRDDLGKNI